MAKNNIIIIFFKEINIISNIKKCKVFQYFISCMKDEATKTECRPPRLADKILIKQLFLSILFAVARSTTTTTTICDYCTKNMIHFSSSQKANKQKLSIRLNTKVVCVLFSVGILSFIQFFTCLMMTKGSNIEERRKWKSFITFVRSHAIHGKDSRTEPNGGRKTKETRFPCQ